MSGDCGKLEIRTVGLSNAILRGNTSRLFKGAGRALWGPFDELARIQARQCRVGTPSIGMSTRAERPAGPPPFVQEKITPRRRELTILLRVGNQRLGKISARLLWSKRGGRYWAAEFATLLDLVFRDQQTATGRPSAPPIRHSSANLLAKRGGGMLLRVVRDISTNTPAGGGATDHASKALDDGGQSRMAPARPIRVSS